MVATKRIWEPGIKVEVDKSKAPCISVLLSLFVGEYKQKTLLQEDVCGTNDDKDETLGICLTKPTYHPGQVGCLEHVVNLSLGHISIY